MKLPSREGMVLSGATGRVPVDETLEVNERNPFSGPAGKGGWVTGRPRSTIPRGLPVMVHLHVNPAIASRVTRRCTRSPIIGNKSRVERVEGEIVESPPAVRTPSVGSIITGGGVL